MARMRIRARRCLCWGATLLGTAWLAGANAQEADPASEASPAVSGATSARVPDPAETTPPPDVSTGQYGTSSGITNSDMLIREEDVGSGQAQGDDLFQTPAAGSEAGPDYDVQTPETQTEASERPGAGGPVSDDDAMLENGLPQSSNTDQSDEDAPTE
ncbi:hypothetical protein HNO52_20150 [Billgrantia diversa]|uniref:hypothetical protein n=1 Tax=Halomonas sp. MCCC 1A13316 TaxID=2733487 RepID=UPI0018A5EE28|nr:hypothetical protein [Halomonas sp. MCCC 1A13316]QOR40579.1 hypothetical protein HNO52_20150 [Halomonas sp. MCCC 1A13316]